MKTRPLLFALPKGWTYANLRAFLQSELNEDQPGPVDDDATDDMMFGGDPYYAISDFDDSMVIYTINWEDTLYQITYTITKTAQGSDVTWGTPIEVAATTKYVAVAELSGKTPHVAPARSEEHKSTNVASFALGTVTDAQGDAWVTRRGTVFEAGDFPDKAIELGLESLSFGPAELQKMIDQFTPVPNRVSHANGDDRTPTIFDAHMGELTGIEIAENGTTLVGSIRIPKWLDDFQKTERGGGPLQASLEIDPVTYRVVGNTIVPNPRIESSALMSAYAAFTAREKTMETKVDPEKTVESVSPAQFAQMKAENEATRVELAKVREERRAERCDHVMEAALREGRMVPAQRAYFENLHRQAGADDAAVPATINFTVGAEAKTGSRVDALEAAIKALPKLMLTRELVPGQDGVVAGFADEPSEKAIVDAAKAQAETFAKQMNGHQERATQNGR